MNRIANKLSLFRRYAKRMMKRKMQDVTICCTYRINFFRRKEHYSKHLRRQFTIQDELGRGGFGIVYKGLRIADDLPVAIKFVKHQHVREWIKSDGYLLPTELAYLKLCKDIEGVVDVIQWFYSSTSFIIVMERPIECMDLFHVINAYGRLSEETALIIFKQVIDTVCALFAKYGLVHRDIKDENIIINMRTGIIKLIDFGATVKVESANQLEFQGTLAYCPPEWFHRHEYLPLEATTWSLGVLLYILVTGKLPYRNEMFVCLGRVKYPQYLSTDLTLLIKSCLASCPASRATFIEITQHPWLERPLPHYSCTFKEALEMLNNFAGSDGSARTFFEDSWHASEEQMLAQMAISSRSPKQLTSSKEKLIAESATFKHAAPQSRCSHSIPFCNNNIRLTKCMQQLDQYEGSLAHLQSKYDSASASSFADYLSTASQDVLGYDNFSLATACEYYSATEFPEDTHE